MSVVGKVTRVQIGEGKSSLRVDVNVSPTVEYENLIFRSPATGMWFIPEVGDVVEVTTVGDNRKIAHSPMQSPGFRIPDDAQEGDIIIMPASDVTIRANKNGNIKIETSGDIDMDAENLYFDGDRLATENHIHTHNGDETSPASTDDGDLT